VVHDFDFRDFVSTAGDLGQLVLVRNPTHHPRGDFGLTAQGRLRLTPPRLTFAGLALLHPRLFAGLAPGVRPLREVLRPAIKEGALTGQYHPGLWMDVGTPARLTAAGALLERLA
jgi:MurNAc alpha-1-phosphate uridylyltransferase